MAKFREGQRVRLKYNTIKGNGYIVSDPMTETTVKYADPARGLYILDTGDNVREDQIEKA